MKVSKSIIWFTWILILSIVNFSCAQSEYGDPIQIGQQFPNITFESIQNSGKNILTIEEMKGKPTILYIFSSVCHASFTPLPQLNQLYSDNKDKINLLLVGLDLEDSIRNDYETFQKLYGLKIPVTFNSIINKKYNIRAVPAVYWIDTNGKVKAITNVLDEKYLKPFVEGKSFEFIDYSSEGKEKLGAFNENELFLIEGNGGSEMNFIQRSIVTKWRYGMPNYSPSSREDGKDYLYDLKYLQLIGRSLPEIYRIAYFGLPYWSAYNEKEISENYSIKPVLEIKDSSKFDFDYSLGRNLYCYSQVLPEDKRTPNQMREVMKRDLKNAFDYDVTVEIRSMPYLALVASDEAKIKLKNQNKKGESNESIAHLNYINRPIKNLINTISYNCDLIYDKNLPLIDETGIEENIDISLNAVMTDLDDVKRALKEQGLEIVQKMKDMKCIVIRDPKPEISQNTQTGI
jgi:thiol-disulfide isomerase/thioredoxin